PDAVRTAEPTSASGAWAFNPPSLGKSAGPVTTDNAFGGVRSDGQPGRLTVDGDLTLDGTLQLANLGDGLIIDGQSLDFLEMTGDVTLGDDLQIGSGSSFVDFNVSLNTENGNTVLTVEAERLGFDVAATNDNAAAFGSALSETLDQVLDAAEGGSVFNSQSTDDEFADLILSFDSGLTREQVGSVIDELASGEFYGSLTTLQTTAPFIGAHDTGRVSSGDGRFSVWASTTAELVDLNGDSQQGSRDVEADQFGYVAGFGYHFADTEIGFGVGYGEFDVDSFTNVVGAPRAGTAEAETWIVGGFAEHKRGKLSLAANLAYAQSEWLVNRNLRGLGRAASAEFDSTELRADAIVAYTFAFENSWIAPFGELSMRQFNFDAFTETGAGVVNLTVDEADHAVFTQTAGMRAGTAFSVRAVRVKPEFQLSYTFAGENDAFRDVATTFDPNTQFRLNGVDPEGFMTMGSGVVAELNDNAHLFLRSSLSPGQNYQASSVSGGLRIRF
ncbi:MAG: autotransporter outer membrane beta-barrel domain-containing protein, partial [Parvularculaceae bacterium]|nr:autotransporter outer membrane beta-barrel domain-containing protein [Parvularculaceae bacterium]